MFGIPYPSGSIDMDTTPKFIVFSGPPYPNAIINFPLPSGIVMSDSVNSVTVPGQAGVPASIWPAGPDGIFTWLGTITSHANPGLGEVPPTDELPAIPQRRWIVGFEIGLLNGEGGSGLSPGLISRDASRTFDGTGLALRGSNANSISILRQIAEYQAGFTPTESWERFYIRKRVNPNTTLQIWRCHGTAASNSGALLRVLPSGNLSLASMNSGLVTTEIINADVLIPFQWHKIDIILLCKVGATDGRIRIWIDGTLLWDFVQGSTFGLGQMGTHFSSKMCDGNFGELTAEIDIDDWICANKPVNSLGDEDLRSLDWFVGSHVRRNFTLSGTVTNWTPNATQLLNQGIGTGSIVGNSLSSSTASAPINGVTDVTNIIDNIGITIGHIAAIISHSGTIADNSDGQIGYSIAGGGSVMATVNETATQATQTVMYRPSGMILPTDIVPFGIHRTKSTTASLTNTYALQPIVENIGVWGPEDDPTYPDDFPRLGWLHNCRYPNTPWTSPLGISDSPTMVLGGTYVGNGIEQNIDLPLPCHFLIIRNLTAVNTPVWWLGASLGGHVGGTIGVAQNSPIRVWTDDLGVTKFTVAGTHGSTNTIAQTYQYIAFCDPGIRFSLAGTFRNPISIAPTSVLLQSPSFLASAAFIQGEEIGSIAGTQTFSYKGPGHTGINGTKLDGVDIPSWGTFGTGFLNTLGGLNVGAHGQNGSAFLLWKGTDNCAQLMVQFVTYTGNAVNPRTIPLTPASGRFPIFTLVISRGNIAHFRDPSHIGTNSCNSITGANSTSAIIAGGIDSIQVQTTLNQNGVIYDVFSICGDTLGWNNGLFYPADCLPPTDAWPLPPVVPPEVAIITEGGLILGDTNPITVLKDVSGIYTLVPGKHTDTLYDRQTEQTSVEMEIPDPTFKTGYIGG